MAILADLPLPLMAPICRGSSFRRVPLANDLGFRVNLCTGASFTGSLPHNRAYASAFYDGPAGTWLAGFDIGATVHYTGQYEDDNIDLTGSSKPQMPRSGPFPWRARKVTGVDYARPDRILYV